MKRFYLRQNPINGQFYMAESPTGEYVEYAALSHAAGQDGELCRATSEGDIPDGSDVLFTLRMLEKLTANGNGEIADDAGCMWGIDQIAGQAIAIIRWAHSRALSRVAVQEGMVLVPMDSAKMVTHVCSEWIDLFRAAPGIEKYERYSYEPAVEELRDEYAAIAASQRQEGGSNG